MPAERVRFPDEPYQDARGDWCDDYFVCAEHAWKHRAWTCPACHVMSAHGDFKTTYVFGGFGQLQETAETDGLVRDEVVDFGPRHIHMAERYEENGAARWRWVVLIPDGAIESMTKGEPHAEKQAPENADETGHA